MIKQGILKVAEDKLLLQKVKRDDKLKKQLEKLGRDRGDAQRTMDYYQTLSVCLACHAAVEQTVIPGYGKNNFSEITYKVDRCQTCHISYPDDYYKDYEHPT